MNSSPSEGLNRRAFLARASLIGTANPRHRAHLATQRSRCDRAGLSRRFQFNRFRCDSRHVAGLIYDLPAGGRRMIQGAEGYRHTVAASTEIMANGVATGALPVRLVRGEQAI
ncbi:MAG: hypothetical protein ABIW48_05930 [Burkholderiales bacterium]